MARRNRNPAPSATPAPMSSAPANPSAATTAAGTADPATGEVIIPPGDTAVGGEPIPTPAPAGLGGAPRVDLQRLSLSGPTKDAVPPGASPARAVGVAEAAGHAVPKTPEDLAASVDLAGDDTLDALTAVEVSSLRRFLRDGFPGERIVNERQAREIKGHLGGQSMA